MDLHVDYVEVGFSGHVKIWAVFCIGLLDGVLQLRSALQELGEHVRMASEAVKWERLCSYVTDMVENLLENLVLLGLYFIYLCIDYPAKTFKYEAYIFRS